MTNMEHIHFYIPPKEKGENGYFKERYVECYEWFSVMACFDGDDDGEETYCDSAVCAWLMKQDMQNGDKEACEGIYWKYKFYYYKVENENGQNVVYYTPVKIYRRGNKIFTKVIAGE